MQWPQNHINAFQFPVVESSYIQTKQSKTTKSHFSKNIQSQNKSIEYKKLAKSKFLWVHKPV